MFSRLSFLLAGAALAFSAAPALAFHPCKLHYHVGTTTRTVGTVGTGLVGAPLVGAPLVGVPLVGVTTGTAGTSGLVGTSGASGGSSLLIGGPLPMLTSLAPGTPTLPPSTAPQTTPPAATTPATAPATKAEVEALLATRFTELKKDLTELDNKNEARIKSLETQLVATNKRIEAMEKQLATLPTKSDLDAALKAAIAAGAGMKLPTPPKEKDKN